MSANIVVADVVVTLDTRDIEAMGIRKRVSFPSIAFGHASLQLYPNTGITIGVPMPAIGAFGMKKAITRMFIQGDPARGYYYVYDPVKNTIRIFQGNGGTISGGTFVGDALAAHTHDIKLIGGITATEPVAVAGGDTLGKNAATDRTIAGAAVATKGGVVGISGGTPAGTISGDITLSVGALSEVANGTVVLVTTLQLMVIGV